MAEAAEWRKKKSEIRVSFVAMDDCWQGLGVCEIKESVCIKGEGEKGRGATCGGPGDLRGGDGEAWGSVALTRMQKNGQE